jgi:hypothetical protein
VCSHFVPMLPNPPEFYTPLSGQEARDAFDISVRLNWRWLRQGKMSAVEREQAARQFANALVDHLALANMAVFKGPPSVTPRAAE